LEVQKAAKAEGLNTYLVMDAGKTQIASGTRTVLCIGPDEVSKVDKVTRHLKLM